MQPVVSRAVMLGIAVLALTALTLASAPRAAAVPSLTLIAGCHPAAEIVDVDMRLEGLPPGEPFTGTLEYFADDGSYRGGIGPLQLTADENGNFGQHIAFGSSESLTFKATAVWAGGTLEASMRADCTPPVGNDYAARVIVNQPTWANAGDGHRRRSFVVKVSNLGSGPFSVDADDIAAQVLVNGGSRGTIRHVATKVVDPGKRVKFRFLWRYRGVNVGDQVEYSGCVAAAGDPNPGNDCGSQTTSAVAKP